ncbi:MAG TPA: hypothetical protein VFC71_08795 [Candidatus Polarisedimenticolia bacterium]|nr:hypothetical protein [Candidatus Polarisedimenticolia bacterium]
MIRSLLAVSAAAWFAMNAVTFLPTPFVYLNEGQVGGIDGDAGAVAVVYAARALFAGLAALSLAVFDWDWLARSLRGLGSTE